MTMQATVSPSLAFSRLGLREAIAWGAAAAAALIAHLAIAYAMQYLRPPESADGGTPPALMIELAPMAVAPAVEEQVSPPDEVLPETAEPVDEPEREPVVDEPQVEPEDSPPETIEPDRTAEAEPVEEQQEPLDQVVPDIVEAVTPEVVIPLPEPRPAEKKAVTKKPVEKAVPRKKKARQPAKPAAVAKADAKPAPKAAAPRKAEGVSKSRDSPASWKAKVHARLKRHQRYPSAAKSRREEGNVQVSFTVDASGRVTSSRIARSSGNAELDRAALEMVRRASPVPAPPPEVARTITVPVVFNLK